MGAQSAQRSLFAQPIMYAEFLTIILSPDLIIYCVIDPSLGWIQIPAKTDPE